MFRNAFGQFASDGRAYTITDWRTPTPWVNVVSNGRYGLVVSQSGGGFSWLDNSQLNVLTRWDMDLVRDVAGRYLYLADRDSGDLWSLAPTPCRAEYDAFACEHALGSTTFTTEHAGIRAAWTLAVAPVDNVELWSVQLTNLSDLPRRLRIASFFEWCCGVAPDVKREFHRLFFTTRHDARRRAVIVTKNMWDVPPRTEAEHWNSPWPYVAAHAVSGMSFERDLAVADKALFLGRYGDPARPAGMTGDDAWLPQPTSFGRFGDAAAALGGDFTLEPRASARLHYTLAITDDPASILPLLDRYRDPVAVDAALQESAARWDRLLSPTRIQTQAPDVDVLSNHWLPYQAISGRLWARTGYYQQSGAYGFRDQLQDSQVWLTLDPARCRAQIVLHAAHQFSVGNVYHWWHPLTETGLKTACSDDYLWLPFITSNYIDETADLSILLQHIPFVDDPRSVTLLEHCRRSIGMAASRLSQRGLPLIGSCDWNDGLSAVGVLGRGESVWLAFFLISVLDSFASVLQRSGNDPADYLALRETLQRAVNAHAWDGQWFRCATLDSGDWIGAADNDEGRIYLNPQTWAVLTGATTPEREDAAWASVRQHLLSPWGPLLLAPAYTQPRADIGYITRYSPGSRENGGVYMHAATWALAAACKRKDVEAVGRIWASISPPRRCADAESYRAEPYVLPGNVDGPLSDTPGRAGWTWYTGSAAWLRKVAMDWMLGVRAVAEGLLIDPCPPPDLGRVVVERAWRGRKLRIRFDARAFTPSRRARIAVNGRPQAGQVLTEAALGPAANETIDVDVSWGDQDGLTTGTVPRSVTV